MAAVAAAKAATGMMHGLMERTTAEQPVQTKQKSHRASNQVPQDSRADHHEEPTSDKESHRLSQVSSDSKSSSHKRSRAKIGPWQLGRTLGRGSSGRVRLAKHSETGQLAAVKILPKSIVEPLAASVNSNPSEGDHPAAAGALPYGLEREVIIMKLIEHPNIMGLYDVWENKGELYLVLEYIEGGELFDYLISRGRLSEREAIHYFRQICYGVDYCHQFNICHRDLKPENLLLDKHRDIKIADFGMAALETAGRMLETSCGSPHYASPEIVAGRTYHGAPSDIWSCGIILFALLTGHLPFDDDNIRQLLMKVQRGVYKLPSHLSAEAKDLITRILRVNPEERLTMKDIFAHPLLAKYPSRRIPAANTDMFRLINASRPVQSRSEIDIDILRNLKTLWHKDSTEKIIQQLLSPEPNPEKTFYCLLIRYRENHYASAINARRKLIAGRGSQAPGSPSRRSTMSKSSIAGRSKTGSRHRRNISTTSKHSTASVRSTRAPRSASRRSVSSVGSRKTREAQRHKRATSASKAASPTVGVPEAGATTSAASSQSSDMHGSLNSAEPKAKSPALASPKVIIAPRTPTLEKPSKARPKSTFADILDQAFNFEETRAVSATVAADQVPSSEPERRIASDPTPGANSLDPRNTFDFSETAAATNRQYLLPLIFEEDRFADAVEEEVELKVYKRRAAQKGIGHLKHEDLESQMRVPELAPNESFYNYQPSIAAAAVPPPVRAAPPIPTASTAAATTTANPSTQGRSENESSHHARPVRYNPYGTRAGPIPRKPVASAVYEDGVNIAATKTAEPPLQVAAPQVSEKENDSRESVVTGESIERYSTPPSTVKVAVGTVPARLTADRGAKSSATGPSVPVQSAIGPQPVPDRLALAPKTDNAVNMQSSGAKDGAPRKNLLRRLTQKRRPEAVSESLKVPMMVTSNDYLEPEESVKEEPRQNWLFKVLNFSGVPTDHSTKTLFSMLPRDHLKEVIVEVFTGWKRYGLSYSEDSAGTILTVAISARNALKLRMSRFQVRLQPVQDGSTAVFVLQRGSRTSYMRFVSELERVLDSARLLGPPKNLK